jgi:hypothetical protein
MNLEDASADLLQLPHHTDQLNDALTRTHARLVVLDPAVSFLHPSICDLSNQSIRRALLPLARLAERHQTVVLLIRHLSKKATARSLYRGLGSIGFMGACRSAWLLGTDPGDPACRVLAPLKNNLAPPQPSLVFSLTPRPDRGTDVTWLGTSPHTADQLLDFRPAPPTKREKARQFVADFLKDGPRTSLDLWAAALPHGYTKITLFRARRDLKIRTIPVWKGRHKLYYWLLPTQNLPDHEKSASTCPEFDALIAALAKDLPPSTPLDDP